LEEKFYYFLQHGGGISSEDLDKLIGEDKIIKKAYKELESFYLTDNERALYDKEEKRVRDNIAVLDYATNKGRQEERKELIKKMIAKGFITAEQAKKL